MGGNMSSGSSGLSGRIAYILASAVSDFQLNYKGVACNRLLRHYQVY